MGTNKQVMAVHNKPLNDINRLSPDEANTLYLTILEKEQNYIQIRWAVVTFFIGISFSILGLSFSFNIPGFPIYVPQFIGCGIYWFAFITHLVLYDLTEYYREYLYSMERDGLVRFDVRTRANVFFANKRKSLLRPHPTRLLLYFGIVYALVVVAVAVKLIAFP